MKQNDLKSLLPEVFQRTILPNSLLAGLLDVMTVLHAPDEQILNTIDAYFDPYRTPERFVPFLARWVDLDRIMGAPPTNGDPAATFPSGLARLRDLIVFAAELSRWSGTNRGLIRFLELATGLSGFTIDEVVIGPDQRPRPFHIAVHIPPESEPYRALITRIVEAEKPAYVTYTLLPESNAK